MIEKNTPVNAGIHTLTAYSDYSSHADQKMLVDWVQPIEGNVNGVILQFR